MIRIFAPGPHRNIPDATAAVQQLERLLAEAGELHDRIASACTGTAAGATHWPGRRPIAAPHAHLAPACTRNASSANGRGAPAKAIQRLAGHHGLPTEAR